MKKIQNDRKRAKISATEIRPRPLTDRDLGNVTGGGARSSDAYFIKVDRDTTTS